MSNSGDRLQRTRLAILEHVHRKDLRRHGKLPGDIETAAIGTSAASGSAIDAPDHRNWFTTARDTLSGWWRYHPAHMAVEIARPALASYARRKPATFVGVAAVAGAALFFMRPWKLISVTGIVVALIKSPQVAGLIMSAMSSSQNPRDDEARPE